MEIQDIANKVGIPLKDLEEFVTFVIQKSVQESMRMLPQVMNHIVQHTDYIHKLTTKFYQDNPGLADKKQLVGGIIEQLESEHPGLPYEELMRKAAITANQKKEQMPHSSGLDKPKVLELDKRFGDL